MKKNIIIISLAICTFLACNSTPKDNSADTNATGPDTTVVKDHASSGIITDIQWNLIEITGNAVSGYAAQNKQPYLKFTNDNRVEGTGGCNGMGGSYALADGNKISFSEMMSTKMACPDMTLENDFQTTLQQVANYSTDGATLSLMNAVGTTIAKFEAAK
ncbi:MAG: META domain-containing protein [Bacteroidia bacterium]|nr:META domain-containing protein [Bacteroidia bacterium]